MSTHAYVGILNEETETVRWIYAHFDGYLDGLGKMLLYHYQDEAKVRELIDRGDMPSVNVDPQLCESYTDKGDPDAEATVWSYERFRTDRDIPFYYLFDDGEWYYRVAHDPHFHKLSEAATCNSSKRETISSAS